MNGPSPSRRSGISLLEVITCTMLVAVLMIPIAGVMRASGQAMARSSGHGSTEAQARRSLHWLGDEIRTNTLQSVAGNGRSLRLQMSSGRLATVSINRGRLLADDGVNPIVLADSASSFRIVEHRSTSLGGKLIGIEMELTVRDPTTRQSHVVMSVLSL